MGNTRNEAFPRSERAIARSASIQKLLDEFAACDDQDLLEEMIVSVCRLAQDGCGRGELKLLNRALKELRYAFKTFAPYSETPKVSIFGSARTKEDHPQFQQAVRFAKLMKKAGWMVITGAGGGIMKAGHYGATREASFGVSISLPFEQTANEIIANDEKLVNFKYFFTRKLMFVKEARAIALFPGGFGTQDEGFEALTLIQTGKSNPMPILLVDEPGGTYWQHWRIYVKSELLHHGMVSPEDMHLFHLTDDAEDAVREVLQFYRVYHSSRFVRKDFVIRLNHVISPDLLDRLNTEYADLLREGRFRVEPAALPEENGEYADKPRLVFAFNRNSVGRLRMMIDVLNSSVERETAAAAGLPAQAGRPVLLTDDDEE
ncbi:MAG: LOG family protein [Phycisphaerae bacterium]|nr:LOG family protein [Phycisphaerae bacterium]